MYVCLLAIAEAAADGVLPDDPQTWDTVLTQATRMQRLVDDTSAVSKAEEHQLDLDGPPVRAANLARDTVDGALPTVSVDAHRHGQVLANLLGNALRHSHPGDEVTVRVRSPSESAHAPGRRSSRSSTPATASHPPTQTGSSSGSTAEDSQTGQR
jgi:signal transduction histidine kinase